MLSRPFRADELGIVQSSLADLQAHYQQNVEQAKELLNVGDKRSDESINPSELAAWTMLINELMNLDEVLSK
jgi:hypothetical protein